MFAFRALSFLVSILASCTLAIPAPKPSTVVREQIQNPPSGFISNGPAPHDTTIKLRLALRSNNLSGLENAVYNGSTPGSPNYGNHLLREEVASYFAPSAKTTSAVQKWLKANDIQATNVSSAGDLISITVNVSKANGLLGTQFDSYTHESTGKTAIRTSSYSLPANLANHIDAVYPTTDFPYQRRGNVLVSEAKLGRRKAVSRATQRSVVPRSPELSSDCVTDGVTPGCILGLYGVPPSVSNPNGSRIGVSAFEDQFAETADLALFLQEFRPDLPPNTSFSLETLDDGQNIQNSSDAGVEANLDIQYTVGVAGGVPVSFISVGDDFQDGVFLQGDVDILRFLMEQDDPPQVLTTSYGQDEDTMPPSLAQVFCNTAMALTSRGISLLFASGDGGVSGSHAQNCTTFRPTFPAGCPFITSVGATQFKPETAAALTTGGFSDIFPMPAYQKSAVTAYLKELGDTNAGLYNKQGRGFPDVAAQGRNVSIINGGEFEAVEGTSCSSPIFASVIGAVNAMRLQAGKKVLGFLNPVLYANPDLFHDITNGSNPGCGTDGFPATTGWDPVTGMGSPNFQKFLELP